MRPIDRGNAPQIYNNYEDAKDDLVHRLGAYCSYCERPILTNLAVEHILPKDNNLGYSHLRNEWTNFLLACVNCNSAKGIQIINFANCILPDRDNTFNGFNYLETGIVEAKGNDVNELQIAQNLLNLVNLNVNPDDNFDEKLILTALGRLSQRVQAWNQANDVRQAYNNGEITHLLVGKWAAATGFFSIWMQAFEGVNDVRLAIISAFANTATNCFDADGNSITPRPQNVNLANSGKI